ncbi:hypothetical protein KDL45_07550 [bacterium]|nr:hypothetical protein [bacterium]
MSRVSRVFFRILVAMATWGCLMWGATPALADVLYSYGFNARGIALGGAASAQSKDFGVAYYNPAGGILLGQPALGAGFMRTGSDLSTNGDDALTLESTEGVVLGAVLPLPFGSWLEDRLAIGFAAFLPQGVFLALDVPYPEVPQFALLRNSGRQATILPTASLRIFDGLAIGGGAQLFSNTNGSINAVIDANGDVQTLVGQEVYSSFAPTYGIFFKPGEFNALQALDGFGLGLVFREEFFMRYRIPLNTYLGVTPIELIFNATSLYTPRQWAAGLSYEWEKTIVEVDASYNEWRKYPNPNLYVDVDFTIPLLNVVFIDSVVYEPNFHDTFTVRGGVERRVHESDLWAINTQLGYFYDPSPVPPQSGVTNYLDNDRHVGSAGIGFDMYRIGSYEFDGPITIQAFGQVHYLVPRKMWKDTSVDHDNPGYPYIDSRGWIYAGGVNVSFMFDYELDSNKDKPRVEVH